MKSNDMTLDGLRQIVNAVKQIGWRQASEIICQHIADTEDSFMDTKTDLAAQLVTVFRNVSWQFEDVAQVETERAWDHIQKEYGECK